jgi:hypothetical protein
MSPEQTQSDLWAVATQRRVTSSEMRLKPAGQILPNEIRERLQNGVVTSLDMDSARERHPIAVKAYSAVFGAESYTTQYQPHEDLEQTMGRLIASHEYGHAAGLVSDTESRLGETLVRPYIEEWKATAGGLVLGYWKAFERGEATMDDLRHALLDECMMAARYAQSRSYSYALPYLRHSIMFMNAAVDAGVISENPEGGEPKWKISTDEDAVMKFYQIVTEQYKTVIELYNSGSPDDLRAYLKETLVSSPFIEYMAARVDESTGVKGPTIASCIAVA